MRFRPTSIVIGILTAFCLGLLGLTFHAYGGSLIFDQISDRTMKFVDLGAMVMGVLSLALAVEAIREGRGLAQKTDQNLENSKTILDLASTKYLGPFPDYLPDVARLISKSEKCLYILATVPTHGMFTDPLGWTKIAAAIQERMCSPGDKPRACLVHATENKIRENYDDLYAVFRADAERWKKWREDHTDAIMRVASSACKLDELSVESFVQSRIAKDLAALKTVYQDEGVQCYAGDQIYPLYCWINDDEAIFSIRTEDQKGGIYFGSAIRTSDPRLLKVLEDNFNVWRERAERYVNDRFDPVMSRRP